MLRSTQFLFQQNKVKENIECLLGHGFDLYIPTQQYQINFEQIKDETIRRIEIIRCYAKANKTNFINHE